VWFHKLDDSEWTLDRYIKITTFDTIHEFWRVMNGVLRLTPSGHFFVMRENIIPMYEDPRNEKGSVWTWRIKKAKLMETWVRVLVHLIGNTLYPDPAAVTGISVNPQNAVIKVWLDRKLPEAGRKCLVTACSMHMDPAKARYAEPLPS
jgi:hypothetical protein